MDLKVALVIVFLCALAITSTEGGIPKCCIRVNPNIPKFILRRTYKVERQYNTGACDINALKLYVKNMPKPICADPKLFEVLITRRRRNT